MAALAALVLRVLAILTTILSYSQSILGFTTNAAQEHSRFALETIASNAANTVDSPTYGNAALKTLIDAINAQSVANTAAILLAIEDLTDGTTPISLPPLPPTGYGSTDVNDVADAVWNDPQTLLPTTPADALLQVARSLNTTSIFDMPLYVGIFRVSRFDWPPDGFTITSIEYPTYDPSDILITDTLVSLLTRQNPGWTIDNAWSPQTYVSLEPGGGGQAHYTTIIDEDGFAAIRNSLFPLATSLIPPIWPGIASVILGTPVAITSQMTVSGPLDGVVVTITTVTTNKPALAYDTELAYRFIGALSFVDDNGDVEPFQQLGFTNAVYSAQRMTHAASAVLRADPGVVGTITPWVIA